MKEYPCGYYKACVLHKQKAPLTLTRALSPIISRHYS